MQKFVFTGAPSWFSYHDDHHKDEGMHGLWQMHLGIVSFELFKVILQYTGFFIFNILNNCKCQCFITTLSPILHI